MIWFCVIQGGSIKKKYYVLLWGGAHSDGICGAKALEKNALC